MVNIILSQIYIYYFKLINKIKFKSSRILIKIYTYEGLIKKFTLIVLFSEIYDQSYFQI